MFAAAAVEMISYKYDGPWKSKCVLGGMRRLLQLVPGWGAGCGGCGTQLATESSQHPQGGQLSPLSSPGV